MSFLDSFRSEPPQDASFDTNNSSEPKIEDLIHNPDPSESSPQDRQRDLDEAQEAYDRALELEVKASEDETADQDAAKELVAQRKAELEAAQTNLEQTE